MTEEMHRALVEQFCKAVGLADAEKLRANGSLLVDGFHVQLACNAFRDDLLDIRVDLGPVPVERERDAYRTMLEINMITSASHSGQIGIVNGDAGQDHAIFSVGMPVTTYTTGEGWSICWITYSNRPSTHATHECSSGNVRCVPETHARLLAPEWLCLLQRTGEGHLVVTDDFLRSLLQRPELAPVAESCAERSRAAPEPVEAPRAGSTHSSWRPSPMKMRAPTTRSGCAFASGLLARIRRWRPATPPCSEAKGWDVPPLFVHQLTQILLRHILGNAATPMQARAAEMLFRTQRVSIQEDGQVMAADDETVERHAIAANFGTIGELLKQGGAACARPSSTCCTTRTRPSTGSAMKATTWSSA
jgi:hypothetical protein